LWYSYNFWIDTPEKHRTGHGITMCRKDAGGRWRILNINNSVTSAASAPAGYADTAPLILLSHTRRWFRCRNFRDSYYLTPQRRPTFYANPNLHCSRMTGHQENEADYFSFPDDS